MLKKYITILFFVVLAARPVIFIGNVLYFETHLHEIVEKYCVNKNKPQLQCNGKCHLAKQVSKTTDEKAAWALADINISFFPVFFQESTALQILVLETTGKRSYFNNAITYTFLFPKGLYKPPIA